MELSWPGVEEAPRRDASRRRRTKLVAAAVAALMAASLTACGNGAGGTGDGAATLVVDTSFTLDSIDPARGFTPTAFLASHGVYQGLLTVRGGGTEVEPLLATSFESSEDARTFTFELNADATFADGSQVTADDVVFSLNRLKNIGSNASFLMAGLSVSAPDQDTVVIESEQPNASVPAITATPPFAVINADLAREHGATDAVDAAKTDTAEKWLASKDSVGAGSGPYVLNLFDAASEIRLGRNPHAWIDDAPFAQVVIRNVQAASQVTNVARGEHEIALDIGSREAEKLESNAQLEVAYQASRFTFFAATNMNPAVSETMADPRVQEAIRYALDYEGLAQLAGAGGEQMAGVVPSWMPGHLAAEDAVVQDTGRSTQLVGGLPPDMRTLELYYPSDVTLNGLAYETLAAKMQQDLNGVGFEVSLVGEPGSTLFPKFGQGEIAFGLSGRGSTYFDSAAYLDMAPGQVQAVQWGWTPSSANAEFTSLADRARSTLDQAERDGLVQEFQRVLNASGPYIPLVAPVATVVSTRDVDNVEVSPNYGVDLTQIRDAS
ncbi:ABC transporter substrate-binding protein [Jiangella muralis]|uniref:ABC transporter substrate-binding protein n=1 Tax=Jiangella muralis TaxID=702383 RepID=UPI00069E0A94|nr:ABC transporter substrate-binding protein [Jiangella muralis]